MIIFLFLGPHFFIFLNLNSRVSICMYLMKGCIRKIFWKTWKPPAPYTFDPIKRRMAGQCGVHLLKQTSYYIHSVPTRAQWFYCLHHCDLWTHRMCTEMRQCTWRVNKRYIRVVFTRTCPAPHRLLASLLLWAFPACLGQCPKVGRRLRGGGGDWQRVVAWRGRGTQNSSPTLVNWRTPCCKYSLETTEEKGKGQPKGHMSCRGHYIAA